MDSTKRPDNSNPQIWDPERLAGSLLEGLSAAAKTNLSYAQFEAQRRAALETGEGAYRNLSRAKRLELKFLSTASSALEKEALAAGFKRGLGFWSDAINEERAKAAAAGEAISNTKLLSRVMQNVGRSAQVLGLALTAWQIDQAVQQGDAQKAGETFLSAIASTVAVTVFLAAAPAITSVAGAALLVTAAGALSYAVSTYVSESMPAEVETVVGDWFVKYFNFDYLIGLISGTGEAIEHSGEALARYLRADVRAMIGELGASNLEGPNLGIEFLGDDDPAALLAQAHTDATVRYALVNGHFFAVRADSLPYDNPGLALDNFSEVYLEDRAAYVAALFGAGTAGGDMPYFTDLRTGITAGVAPGSSLWRDVKRVTFGSERADAISGGDAGDDLFGGGRGDTLRGGGGRITSRATPASILSAGERTTMS